MRFVVPTSTSRAPDCSVTSGILKFPPISTLSPRETATSREFASAATTNNTAAALLFTTIADSAPHNSASNLPTVDCRDPRSPVAMSNSRFEARFEVCDATGARPRFVCNNTPVALTTSRNKLCAKSPASSSAIFFTSVSEPFAIARRAISTRTACGNEWRSASSRASASTDGGRPAVSTDTRFIALNLSPNLLTRA